MNINQIKTRIFILKAIDFILVVSLMVGGIYSVIHSDNKEFTIIACLVGLFLVNSLGQFTNNKVAIMRIQLDMLIRDKKKEEQRTLMGTRHTTINKTRTSAGTITNPIK
jgi:uncharacterized membrane protein